jgi:hypothetical protein
MRKGRKSAAPLSSKTAGRRRRRDRFAPFSSKAVVSASLSSLIAEGDEELHRGVHAIDAPSLTSRVARFDSDMIATSVSALAL